MSQKIAPVGTKGGQGYFSSRSFSGVCALWGVGVRVIRVDGLFQTMCQLYVKEKTFFFCFSAVK